MKYLLGGLVVLAVAAAGLMVWTRNMTVAPERYHVADRMPEEGDHIGRGGFATVRRVEDPQAALAAVAERIAATPRTQRLAGSVAEGHVSYVTRSPVWGFPDVTNVWIDENRLAIRGHLVIGIGDMGVNRDRIETWISRVPALSTPG